MLALAIAGAFVAWLVCSLLVAHAMGAAARARDRYMAGDAPRDPFDPAA